MLGPNRVQHALQASVSFFLSHSVNQSKGECHAGQTDAPPILAAMMLSPAVYAQTPIVIKFSHVVAADTPKGMAAERFKQLAEQPAVRSGLIFILTVSCIDQ
jgi:hypothetical protein